MRIYASPITGNSFGENIKPRTDMFTLDADGAFAQANITVSIPIDIPDGEFAMGFYYNRDTKELEGLPINSISESFIAVVMRKPGDFFITSIPTAKLAGKHASAFTPGTDDWDMINEGTAGTPNGQSAGMTLSALWYYHRQTAKGQPHLWGKFNSEYDDPPKLWYDNVEGIQFATQTELAFDWHKNWKQITANVNSGMNDFTRNAIAYSILVTNKPQLVALSGDKDKSLPMIVYKKDESGIYFSDPTFQAKDDQTMQLLGSKPGSYSTALSTIAYKKQDFTFMRYCAYMGVGAIVDFEKIGQINQAISGPPFTSKVTFNAFGKEIVEDGNKIFTFADSLQINIDSSGYVCMGGSVNLIGNGYTLKLKEGVNLIGVLSTSPGYYIGTTVWRAWKWYEIVRAESLYIIPLKDTGYVNDELVYVVKKMAAPGIEYALRWDLGDGSDPIITDSDTLRVSYKKIGEYALTATLRDHSQVKDVAYASAKASIRPFLFSISPLTIDLPVGYGALFATQKAHSSTRHLRYEWEASDGSKVIVNDTHLVFHKFTLPGQYSMSLKVFETTTNSLFGFSSVSVPVTVHELQPTSLEVLQSMKFVSISFTGYNSYYHVSSGTGYSSRCETLSVSGGSDSDSSAQQIAWDNNSFVSLRGDSKHGSSVSGELLQDGSSIKIDARSWSDNSYSTSGRDAFSITDTKNLTLAFQNIPAVVSNQGTVKFYLSSSSVKVAVIGIGNSSLYWLSQNGPDFYESKGYTATDWFHSSCSPSVVVTFSK